MKLINSGSGKIPLISLLAILSISLTVNLPGLAITPIMGELQDLFPGSTRLEIQLLTVLPNLVIIPFILLSGKICTPKNQIYILTFGLVLYALTGVAYFFAKSMIVLILLGCVLGMGCGLVAPLATSLVSQYFTGKERVRQLGMTSAVGNFMIIIATMFVGWIAVIKWHLAFIVYMIPVIPIILMPFMTSQFITANSQNEAPDATHPNPSNVPVSSPAPSKSVIPKRSLISSLGGLIAPYFAITYATEVISYYLPFTMHDYKMSSGHIGVATSMFFLAVTVSGTLLTVFTKVLRKNTIRVSILMCSIGLLMMGLFHDFWGYIVSIIVIGLGYGMMQPIIYDKTTVVAPTKADATRYFSILMTANYVAISLVPFIVELMAKIFGENLKTSPNFSFYLNAGFMAILFVIAVLQRKSFIFNVDVDTYIEK